jgi:SHS2 domain-containing protein
MREMGSFEIIEHTADVGIRAHGATREELFEQATLGLANIIGIATGRAGERVPLSVEADDLGGLLVDWLSEVLYLHEVRDALLAGVHLDEVSEQRAAGYVELVERDGQVEGTQVKAITYHGLRVEPDRDGWMAQVYVDV